MIVSEPFENAKYGANWVVIHGDGKEILNVLYEMSTPVDHIITDPPYTAHVHKNMRSANTTARIICKPIEATFNHLEEIPPVRRYCELAKRWVICFCALEQLGDYQRACQDLWIRSGIYRKQRAVPQFSGDRPGNACEGLSIFHRKGRKRWNGRGSHAFWEAMPEARAKTGHPSGKPLKLTERLVELFTDPGDLIFDPYFGTGSIGVAAVKLGRRIIGVELQEQYVNKAIERLTEAERGLNAMARPESRDSPGVPGAAT